jgi:hypothetical protein
MDVHFLKLFALVASIEIVSKSAEFTERWNHSYEYDDDRARYF